MPFLDSVKSEKGHRELSPYHLKNLSKIYHMCDAKIVLSSTWRDLDDKSCKDAYEMWLYLVNSLAEYDMKIYDKTEIINMDRPLEINTYIEKHKKIIDRFCILDDDFTGEHYSAYGLDRYLIPTRFFCNNISDGGLQEKHVELAIKMLN